MPVTKHGKQDLFLIAHYRKVPKFKKMTSQKGFGDNPDNWTWDEHVEFKQKLSDKDFLSANVVLALHQRKVMRNSMNPGANYDALYMYFYSNGYREQLDKVREAENMVKQAVQDAMDKYKTEHPESTEGLENKTNGAWMFPKSPIDSLIDDIEGINEEIVPSKVQDMLDLEQERLAKGSLND